MSKINEYLRIEKKGTQDVISCKCGHIIGPAKDNYKEHVLQKELPLQEAGPYVNPLNIGGGKFVFRKFYCPCCATLLDTEVALKGAPILWDVQIKIQNS